MTTVIPLLGLLAALLVPLLAPELRAWSPAIARVVVHRLVRKLPEDDRHRFLCEWLAEIDYLTESGRPVSALFLALGLFACSRRTSRDLYRFSEEKNLGVQLPNHSEQPKTHTINRNKDLPTPKGLRHFFEGANRLGDFSAFGAPRCELSRLHDLLAQECLSVKTALAEMASDALRGPADRLQDLVAEHNAAINSAREAARQVLQPAHRLSDLIAEHNSSINGVLAELARQKLYP